MIKISTVKLQEMVAKAVKGASNNKLIPLTSLMAIEVKDNQLTLITTDASNYLYVRDDIDSEEEFYVVVSVDVFSKLISRLTSEYVTLDVKENMVLQIFANGTYTLELPVDENGALVRYPDPVSKVEHTNRIGDVSRATIDTILTAEKSALAVTLENPCYTGYYVGDRVVATDTYIIAQLAEEIFKDGARLISSEMMNLLAVTTCDKVDIYSTNIDNQLIVSAQDCTIYGPVMEGIEEYAIEAITQLIDSSFTSMCRLSKQTFLQLLDRLSLFVGTYDKNALTLTFTKDGLMVASKAMSGMETIPYLETKDFTEFVCNVDVQMITNQIKAQIGDVVELYYGHDSAIKLVDGKVTQIIALLEE